MPPSCYFSKLVREVQYLVSDPMQDKSLWRALRVISVSNIGRTVQPIGREFGANALLLESKKDLSLVRPILIPIQKSGVSRF